MDLRDYGIVHMERDTRMWVDIKKFVIDPAKDDGALLAEMIATDTFASRYSWPFDPDEKPEPEPKHGPWFRKAINPSRYEVTTAPDVEQILWAWVEHPELEPSPEPYSPEVIAEVKTRVIPLFESGRIYRLNNPSEDDEYEFPVVGCLDFHEFVVIDRKAKHLYLIVASDD